MAPTTRSTKGRSSAGSKASSPQVQAGPSRGVSQQGPSQRVAGAPVRSGTVVVESDEDEDDDDEDEEEDDDDDDEDEDEDDDDDDESEDDDDESEDESENEGEDDPDVPMKLRMIFACTEPNGLRAGESGVGHDRTVSNKYRQLRDAVIAEALQNAGFCTTILDLVDIPSNERCHLVHDQLRKRFDLAVRRSNPNAVGTTAHHMAAVIKTIDRITGSASWHTRQYGIKIYYFSLLLNVLQHILKQDFTARTPGSGSGGSSPFTGDPASNHNLLQIMATKQEWPRAAIALDRIYSKMNNPLPTGYADAVRKLLGDVGKSSVPGGVFTMVLSTLCGALPTPSPRSSRGR